jgi:hypothetical protein
LTLRAIGETQQMTLAPDGGVMGSSFQLRATSGGYFGVAGAQTVDLNSIGLKIVGVAGGGVVNLHLLVDGDAVQVQGLFAGRLGRLFADSHGMSSWFGGCRYDLEMAGARFEGLRTCPRVHQAAEPVSVELPSGFADLPGGRRAMLLALLLAG